jgi:hypothetical protein
MWPLLHANIEVCRDWSTFQYEIFYSAEIPVKHKL